MSKKPTKKSDLNKEWYRSRDERPFKRNLQPEYHLIVTEGTKTEPKYFEALRDKIKEKYEDRISVQVDGLGDNTVNLFYRAKKIADESPNVFKHVWIVYDIDDFPPENINLAAELCRTHSSEQTEYHAAWSNQCIELWFLLHFSYFHSDIHREEYYTKLTQQLKRKRKGEYKKNRDDLFDILKPHIDTAIANAKKLANDNEGKTPAQSAPGTEVYKIIEKLKPYLDS